VQDFDTATAIIRMSDNSSAAMAYSFAKGEATLADPTTPVKREESWIVNKLLQKLGLRVNSEASSLDPIIPTPEKPQMDEEAIAALLDKQAEKLQANMVEALAPIASRLDTLEANQSSSTAEAEKPKREAVAKVIGELAANKLAGAELDEAFGKLQGAAPIVGGFLTNAQAPEGVPGADYFTGGK